MGAPTAHEGVMPRRFLVLSSCPEVWGGSEELWWAAAMELRRRGHDVDVIRLVLDPAHPRIAALVQSGCRVGTLSRHGARVAIAASAFVPEAWRLDGRRHAAVAAAAAIARRRPAAVLVSQGQCYDGLTLAHASRLQRVPYVLVSQKAAEAYWPRDEFRARAHSGHAAAHASIFVSRHNRQVTEDQIGPIPHARVMRNPVLVGAGGPLPWPGDAGPARLACVARLDPPEKGQDGLLRALARDPWPERDYELTLFGSGPRRLGLEDLAGRLGLHRVTFAGQAADVDEIWREHHVLVLPSRAEGLPLTLIEAMTLGRPALVTDVGGNAEVVEDGVTGFLASGPEVGALAAALERAWGRRADWEAMGARAAERARDLARAQPGEDGAELADLLEDAAAGRAASPERADER